jgi:NitT/TauT family transport system substrate-binding protein
MNRQTAVLVQARVKARKRSIVRVFGVAVLNLLLICALLPLAACTSGASSGTASGEANNNTATGSTPGGGANSAETVVVRIGTMPTEDMLPYWVAEAEGIFKTENLTATITTFQSAQELSTALAAGEIDMAMTDPMVAASLVQGGTSLRIAWVTLGETADQGRFGILVNPASGITSLEQLAGVPIAVGSDTVPEYVMDELLLDAGVPSDQIKSEEVKKVPVRYEMVANNQVAAAALPASLLYLGGQNGLVVVADDTTGRNISQSVMVVRTDWEAQTPSDAMSRLQSVWDAGAKLINDDPENWRALLTEKAQLPDPIAATYPVSSYPLATGGLPKAEMIDAVLQWMQDKDYLTEPVKYNPTTGQLSVS